MKLTDPVWVQPGCPVSDDAPTKKNPYSNSLVCAAKSSAGELEKTQSRLRIPRCAQLCPLLLQRMRCGKTAG